jgi:hypothetical protein
LDGAGKIPSDYLPSYVDDVVEYDDLAGFPGTGETGKIYVAKDTGYTYRWTGSVYVRIGSGGEVELNLGSAGSPSLFFNGDANTGLYSPGADQVAISTSGTGRLFVDASGQVGIGAAPLSGHQFTVNGSNLARICLQTAALGQTTADGFSLETDSSATYFTNRENTPSIFYTNNTERLRIDSSGRLLVGTPSNSGGALLQVNDNRIRIATAKTPASASDTGTAGEICWDADYIYVCTATDTWKRTAISTW